MADAAPQAAPGRAAGAAIPLPPAGARLCVHATAIAVAGYAVLIRGPSGSGKSDLALRCLAVPAGVFAVTPPQLVADDQVEIDVALGGVIRLRSPHRLAGLIEVRGIGIVALPAIADARLALVADIASPTDIDRMPDHPTSVSVCGHDVPHLWIAARDHAAPLKLLLALARATGCGQR